MKLLLELITSLADSQLRLTYALIKTIKKKATNLFFDSAHD